MNLKAVCKSHIVVPGAGSKLTRTLAGSLCLSAVLLVLPSSASIYTLAPGGNITATSSGFPTGGTLLDSISLPYTSPTIAGTVTSKVYSGDPSNPYSGGLTFTYSLTMSGPAGTIDAVSELTAGGYAGFQTDVSYNPSGGGIAPSNFSRSSAPGDVLQFFFSNGGGIALGDTSALIVVQTDAHNFEQNVNGGVIDSQPSNVGLLTPAVPEPAIGSLLATGLGILFVFRRRNSK